MAVQAGVTQRFAMDRRSGRGVVTAALNISNQVVRFSRAGPVRVLADNVHNGVQNPSAVAFGPHHELFITSAAYFGSHPALQVIEQGPGRFK
jgi:hypothetical protein